MIVFRASIPILQESWRATISFYSLPRSFINLTPFVRREYLVSSHVLISWVQDSRSLHVLWIFVLWFTLVFSYGEPGYHIIMTTIRHLFPQKSIKCEDIEPLSYSTYVDEVLALEAAARLIEDDMKVDYPEAVKVLYASHSFGNHHYDSDAPDITAHIKAAALRGMRPTSHNTSVYHDWIISGSDSDINDWVKAQFLSADSEELRIKQEEMDADPLAALDNFSGRGIQEDPIDLTLEDSD